MPSAPQIIEDTLADLGVERDQAWAITNALLMALYEEEWHFVSTPAIVEIAEEERHLACPPGMTMLGIRGAIDDKIIEDKQVIYHDGPARTAAEAALVRRWLQGLLGPLGVIEEREDTDGQPV